MIQTQPYTGLTARLPENSKLKKMSKKATKTLTELLDELRQIQISVESGNIDIDQIPYLIQRATAIKEECEARLTDIDSIINAAGNKEV